MMRVRTMALLATMFVGACNSGSSSTVVGPSPTATASDVPACVARQIAGGEAGRATVATPAPAVSPDRGTVGVRVQVLATDLRADVVVDFIAQFGEGDCQIEGNGDLLLGRTHASAEGVASLTLAWPKLFAPYTARHSIPETPLPPGRYYIIAIPCTPDRTYCSPSTGSDVRNTFTLTA